ncbi:GGDEF domain-containing protein [Prauserella cavernicola]|uniref:GGDEF domain-containing protein n=1 Tax=Prauserella cavernicola TaxID=2800127 RepID=A0A934QY37_9PSEU|nr:GGDEF domain-containing protein [Prauserella cavernicola]MBK1788850.1 GGDEF domain-containing protein [Prauserella cavernicola]
MDAPATGPLSDPDGPSPDAARRAVQDRYLRALRARWRTASLASGWRFPSDWGLPEVDAVCAAVVKHGGADGALPALAGLGRARAASGAGLEETLTDLAALHAVLADPDSADGFVAPDVDATPARLLRVTAVAWADVALDHLTRAEVRDPLTGLPTGSYLRTRLAELYRLAERDDAQVADDHTLVVVTMNLAGSAGWSRLTGMILAADALRVAFDGGESLAVLGPSTVAAVATRDAGVATRAVRLRRELAERLAVDAQLREVGKPRINVVRLPGDHVAACELLDTLSRN